MLELDAFVRAIAVNSGSPHCVLLGAGASVSSQIPSAEQCIREWKRSIFLSNNPGMEAHFTEIALPSVMERVQRWLDAQGCYPANGDPDEYGYYIEKCYPVPEHRRRFFEEKVQKAVPSSGYRQLVLLAEAEIVRSVWTTNFDALTARAAGDCALTAIEVTIDAQSRIDRQPTRTELLCVSLHGDYRYDSLKNAADELREQEARLENALVKTLESQSLIVCGYSGRDESVMRALTRAYAEPGSGTLYWCGYGDGDTVPESIRILLAAAQRAKRNAFYVPGRGFDDLMRRLALHCLTGGQRDRAIAISQLGTDESVGSRNPLVLPERPVTGLIKSNAFRIRCPKELFQFGLKEWPSEHPYKTIEDLADKHGVVAAPLRGSVMALGTLDGIEQGFGDNIEGGVKRTPISESDLRYDDGVVISVMRKALVRSIAESLRLGSDQNRRIWTNDAPEKKTVGGTTCWVNEQAVIHLRLIDRDMYLVIEPSVRLVDSSGNEFDADTRKVLKSQILGYQHNKEYNEAVEMWRERILKVQKDFEYPVGSASAFSFHLWSAPEFASFGSMDKRARTIALGSKISALVRRSGVELAEPTLLFSAKDGRRQVRDWHPIRGMATNRPFDYPLTAKRLAPEVALGIVCVKAENSKLQRFLSKAHARFEPARTEADYLLPYPGFAAAYGLPLAVPEPGQPSWVACTEPAAGVRPEEGARSVAHSICRAVDNLRAAYNPSVVVIYFPDRWEAWRGFENAVERFDVHDFVKAYCVQRGIATQFLNEDTLSNTQSCRVWWWLSLALYVKSMRIPWILDALDADTAYVGLGFCMSRDKASKKHIVMGCSHIYNAQGEGLQYRLSKIENPVIRNRNPFMSREDAARVAENIQQMFFEARGKIPRRVVLHKLTPFRRDERLGLLDGLQGVSSVDMLEINVDPCLRYVASKYKGNGQFEGDGFPVHRGVVVPVGEYRALLWVHGVTEHVSRSGWNYYQGKRRIPAPLCITRHCGETDLQTLGTEILGLSKMNWNSFDMYAQLPATVQSSKHIASIGSLLERFNDRSFDYRLFI